MKIMRVVALLLLVALSASAQADKMVERLPANTSAYLVWRGYGTTDAVRASNSLLKLWNDPDFAPARKVMTAQFFAGALKGMKEAQLSREEVEAVFDLFSNPFIVGLVGLEDVPKMIGQRPTAKPPVSFYAIFDRTGKEELHQKFLDVLASRRAKDAEVSTYDLEGTSVTKTVTPQATQFQAAVGRYYVSSDQQDLFEEVVRRFKAPNAPVENVRQVQTFESARPFVTQGAVAELYVQIPDLTKIQFPPDKDVDSNVVVAALHLERLKGLAASLSLAERKTRVRVMLVGETSPGSIFDLWGESTASFQTVNAAPSGAMVAASKVDLPALYQTLRDAMKAGMKGEQAGTIDLAEATIGMQLGITIEEFLNLLTGEIGIINNEGTSGPSGLVSLVGLRKGEEVLRLLKIAMAQFLKGEEMDGAITYLAVGGPANPEANPSTDPSMHLAVGSQALLLGPQRDFVRQTSQRLGEGAARPDTLGADAAFIQARSGLPAKLSGITYADLATFPWDPFATGFVEGLQKSAKEYSLPESEKLDAKALAAIFSHYLHTVVSGWWKDPSGIFAEISIE